MGGIIFIGLVLVVLVILVLPALRNRWARPRDPGEPTEHEAVISRLEDHRKRRQQTEDAGDG